MFKATITIDGASRIAKAYRNKRTTLPNIVEGWLGDDAKNIVREGIKSNFDSESADGKKWDELAPRTMRERSALGYNPSHPILKRTGGLLEEALGISSNNSKISRTSEGMSMRFYLNSKKARTLHFGDTGMNVPARPFMLMTKNADKELRLSFHKLIFNKL